MFPPGLTHRSDIAQSGSNPVCCGSTRSRGSGGFALPVVLGFIIIGTLITVAVLSYATTTMKVGVSASERSAKITAETNALDYLLAIIRPNMAMGFEGDTQSRTVAGVTATCIGQTGSGVFPSGSFGRTDRVIVCTTPSINSKIRYFDRGGSKAGVIEEILRWDVKG